MKIWILLICFFLESFAKIVLNIGSKPAHQLGNLTPNISELYFSGSGAEWVSIDGIYSYVIPEGGQFFDVTYVNNLTSELTIIHGHGFICPIKLDGTPYISDIPLSPTQQVTYQYSIKDMSKGTYWIHSHYSAQLEEGLFAPVILKENDPSYPLYNILQNSRDMLMLLRDVCPFTSMQNATEIDCNPMTVYSYLQMTSDPDGLSSCPDVISADESDVNYLNYTVNGRVANEAQVISVSGGTYVRLRVINVSGMSHYLVTVPSILSPQIIAVDGHFVVPLSLDKFWIATSQRVDVLLQIPSFEKAYSIIASSQHNSSSPQAGIIISVGNATIPSIDNFGPSVGFMGVETEQLLEAWAPLSFKQPDRILYVNLTGDNGFKGINNLSYQLPPMVPVYQPNPNPLYVKQGERVHIVINNQNSDNHAMHLHGHDFQVISINGNPINGALRDTVLVPGGCNQVVIAFDANNPGIWLFHCHMEYHMFAGMMTTVEYISAPNPQEISHISYFMGLLTTSFPYLYYGIFLFVAFNYFFILYLLKKTNHAEKK